MPLAPHRKDQFHMNPIYLTAFKFTLAKGILIPILVTGGSFQANNQIPEILLLLFLWN